jgi:hypothetical protein
MDELILKKLKLMKGSFLGIGLENEKILDEIKKKDFCEIIFLEGKTSIIDKNGKQKNKLFNFQSKKIVNVKKLKKSFKKKSVDNIICNYKYISKFTKHFVSNSIYINKGTLLIYGDKCELDDLIKKYKRYNCTIELTEKDNMFLLSIDNSNSKNNKLKDIVYFIVDTFTDICNVITDILIG